MDEGNEINTLLDKMIMPQTLEEVKINQAILLNLKQLFIDSQGYDKEKYKKILDTLSNFAESHKKILMLEDEERTKLINFHQQEIYRLENHKKFFQEEFKITNEIYKSIKKELENFKDKE
jgi:hypothetical protein